MLLALKHLKDLGRTCSCDSNQNFCEDYKCRMRYRIQRTCQGHLLWLSETTEKPRNILSSHYWATGKVIENAEDSDRLPKKSIVDMPFHIIKAADFHQIITNQAIREDILKGHRIIFKNWIQDLHQNNKSNKFVFPNSIEEPVHQYFFAEQAMIWRALKSGEELGFDSKIHIGKNTMSYSALDIQNSILQKFSCDGPVPNNPMIAISRSPYGNTFKLRTQDTAIIYSADHGIFTPSEKSDYGQSKVKSWMNTLVYQTEFDGSSNSSWGDLSQAALAVIMLANSRRTKSDSMKRKYESAISALLQSSSPNGLLTGQLNKDEELVIPKTFSEHHSYWLGTFEMPYILWIYGEDSLHTNRPISEEFFNSRNSIIYNAERTYTQPRVL